MSTSCPTCAAPLDYRQTHCVNCGTRLSDPRTAAVEPLPVPPPSRLRRTLLLRVRGRTVLLTLPGRGAAASLSAGVLAAGVLVGVAIGPVANGSSAADAQRIVALARKQPGVNASTPTTSSSDSGGASGASSTDSGSASGGSGSGSSSSNPTTGSSSSNRTTGSSGPNSAAPGSGSGTSSDSGMPSSPSTDNGTNTTATPGTPAPAKPLKLNLRGVVVSSDAAAQRFVVADSKGQLHEVHLDNSAAKLATTVQLAPRKLANGTLEATRLVTAKQAPNPTVEANGVVSFVDQLKKRYVLSVRGVSLLIAASGTAVPALPALAHRLKVEFLLPSPTAPPATPPHMLSEQGRTDRGSTAGPIELTGVLTAVDPVAHRLTLSADGANTSGDTIALAVPAEIDLKKVAPLEAVVVHATAAADGTYTLTGADADTGVTAADDPTNQLGDFASKTHPKSANTPTSRR